MASTIPVEPVSNGSSSPSTGEDDKRITMEKLKEHTTRDSMWLLLHDKVYDVTRFLDEVGVSFDKTHPSHPIPRYIWSTRPIPS